MTDAIEAAARWEWMCGILTGEGCSDIAESFPEIRQLMDLVDENRRLKADLDMLIERHQRMVSRADYDADISALEAKVPVWILVDYLPESDQTVLICKPDSDNPVDVGFHDGEKWFDYNGAPLSGRDAVNYWMPLPEPKITESV